MAVIVNSPAGSDPFYTDEYRDHPARVLARLRPVDPVHYLEPLRAWIVIRHDLVRQLLTDPNVTNDPRAYEHHRPAPTGTPMHWIQEHGLLASAPGDHTRMRRLVSAALTPRAVARMEGQIRDVVEQFAAPLRGRRGVVDLYAEFFEPIPNTVISRITGVAPKGEDEARFRGLAKRYLMMLDPFLTGEQLALVQSAIQELHDWLRDMARRRQHDPGPDLISDLVRTHDMNDELTVDEIVAVISAMISAGSETMMDSGAFGLRTLLDHPEALAELRADRPLLPNAVNELLRYDFGPGDWLPRYARQDFELAGRPIHKGQLLMLSFMGAHRDPDAFPDPDRLDLRRDTHGLITFGHGPHFCLGASLARQQLRCMFDAVLDFLPPGSELLADQIKWIEGGDLFPRLQSMPVNFAPTGRTSEAQD